MFDCSINGEHLATEGTVSKLCWGQRLRQELKRLWHALNCLLQCTAGRHRRSVCHQGYGSGGIQVIHWQALVLLLETFDC